METTWQDVLAFDQLAWVLSACIVLSYVVASIWNEENCSLVHPLILAHQAKFSPTRKQGETPTITSSGATTHLVRTYLHTDLSTCSPAALLFPWLTGCCCSYLSDRAQTVTYHPGPLGQVAASSLAQGRGQTTADRHQLDRRELRSPSSERLLLYH
jgi:hypothetical protein